VYARYVYLLIQCFSRVFQEVLQSPFFPYGPQRVKAWIYKLVLCFGDIGSFIWSGIADKCFLHVFFIQASFVKNGSSHRVLVAMTKKKKLASKA
jgi:hypothetical protein